MSVEKPLNRLQLWTARTLAVVTILAVFASLGLFMAAVWTTGSFWPQRLAGTGAIMLGVAFFAAIATVGVAGAS